MAREPRKKGKRGPEKGGEFERLVCRALTTWIDPTRENGKPELFWRSATSGAKATQDTKAGRKANQGGDLIAIADEVLGTSHFWLTGAFSIECKDRADYGNLDLLFTGQGDFLEWWKKARSDANRTNRIPMMICKRLRKPTLLVLPMWVPTVLRGLPGPSIIVETEDTEPGIVIYLFNSWLRGTKADDVGSLAEDHKQRLRDSYLASRRPKHPRQLKKAGK